MFFCEYWEIFKDSFFYRTPLVAASGIDTIFLVCDTCTTLKIYKIVWHKHSLMISSSVVSCHPGMYSCRILHGYLSEWGNLSGKIISIKRHCKSNLVSFFKLKFLFSHLLPLFQDTFTFGVASNFFRVTTSTEQLLFRSSISSGQLLFSFFSEQSLFRRNYFSE